MSINNKFLLILILIFFSCSGDDSSENEIAQSTPSITTDKKNITFDDTMVSKASPTESFLVQSSNLDSSSSISVSTGFEISINGQDFVTSLVIEKNQSKLVYVRFVPTEIQSYNGNLTIVNSQTQDINISLDGNGIQLRFNYKTFNKEKLFFPKGENQSSEQSFDLHDDDSNIEKIMMYIRIECPNEVCDPWDRFANILVKDKNSGNWYEMARHITPYGVGNDQLERGLEVDVTDFKSLLFGNVELKIYAETWVSEGWTISLEFDFLDGEPDYKHYRITPVIQFNRNSLDGVPYGGKDGNTQIDEVKFDLKKTISIGSNINSAHFRTIISGWGHATPRDSDGRPCAEWCFRNHKIMLNNAEKCNHYMGPINCLNNPVKPQKGNWDDDRAGWCPGMLVPVRIDNFDSNISNSTINFEYYFEPWTNDFVGIQGYPNKNAFYAISTFIVLKSNVEISSAVVSN